MCTYNDDIESTAAAVVGALYGAVQVSGVPRLADQHFLFVGAGQASIGSARLVAKALGEEGLSKEEARKRNEHRGTERRSARLRAGGSA